MLNKLMAMIICEINKNNNPQGLLVAPFIAK